MDFFKQFSPSASAFHAIFIAFTGFSLWAISDAVIRDLKEFDVLALTFGTSLVVLMILLILSRPLGGIRSSFDIPKSALRLLVLRGVLLGSSGLLSFIVFTNLPLTTAYAIIFIAPLLAKILSSLLTKEVISLRSWSVSVLGFIGVLIVVRPGILPMNIGTLSAFAMVFLFAAGYVLGRKIGRDNLTFFSMSIFQNLFVVAVLAPFAFPALLAFPPHIFAMLAVIAGLNITGSICVANSYASAPTAYVAPVHYVQIVWGAALGALLFGEYPDLYTTLGASIIIIAGLLLIKYSR